MAGAVSTRFERRLVPPALELAHEQQRVLLGVFDQHTRSETLTPWSLQTFHLVPHS